MKRLTCAAVAAAIFSAHAMAAAPAITTFDPAGSSQTFSVGITSTGAVAGYYQDAQSVGHGFLRDEHGKTLSFDPKGSVFTRVIGMNNAGTILGTFAQTGDARSEPFLRLLDGTIRPLAGLKLTNPTGINTEGTIIGDYRYLSCCRFDGRLVSLLRPVFRTRLG